MPPCEQSIASSAEKRCNQENPASRQTAWCWASFCCVLGLLSRIKSSMCRSFSYAVLTHCALPITVTVRSRSKNEHFSLYGEKAREEKEGERRLWERCVNRFPVFHGFHSRSEGEKGEMAFSLRRLAAALLLFLFSLNIRDYSASLLGVTGRKSSCTPSLRSKHMVFASATQKPRTL